MKKILSVITLISILGSETSAFAVTDPDHSTTCVKNHQKSMIEDHPKIQEIKSFHRSYNGLREQKLRTSFYGISIGITLIMLCNIYRLCVQYCE